MTNSIALAYVLDKLSIVTALSTSAEALGERMHKLVTAASLTHALSFHDPDVLVDELLAAQQDTLWGANWHVRSERLVLDRTLLSFDPKSYVTHINFNS